MSWARKYLHTLRWQAVPVAKIPKQLGDSEGVREKIREHARDTRDAHKAKPKAKRHKK